MTTTRYFEVKVTGCMNCHKSDLENMLCLLGDFSWNDGRNLYQQNKDQLTDSCPMAAQHKESMTTTIDLSQMLDEIAKSADWHESLDSVSISRINQAAQRLRELEAQVTDLELKLLTERGAKAWKDVPDATAFVEELRGNKEST